MDSIQKSLSEDTSSTLNGNAQHISNEDGALQKGLLWQQRDRLFSRWKQRYFILTRDYLNCFRKTSDKISDMGQFLFKVKLIDIDRVEWINKRNYSMIVLHLGPAGRDGRLLLRAAQGLADWMESLEDCCIKSKKRREMLRMSHGQKQPISMYLKDRENDDDMMNSYNSGRHDWLLARRIAQLQKEHYDSVPDVSVSSMRTSLASSRSGDQDDDLFSQRHSLLLTSIDMNTLDSSISMRGRTPCKQNRDIFFMTGGGSSGGGVGGVTPSASSSSARQRASIASPFTTTPNSSLLRRHQPSLTSFHLPNMLHTTRGTANRYSFLGDENEKNNGRNTKEIAIYSTYDSRITAMS